MPNHDITITGIDSKGELILSDGGQTNVGRGDTVTWKIDSKSGVKEINRIVKTGGDEIYEQRPKKENGSKSWKGEISATVKIHSKEIYSIEYTPEQGTPAQFDPIIQVNS